MVKTGPSGSALVHARERLGAQRIALLVEGVEYEPTEQERAQAVALGAEAARRVDVPFSWSTLRK